MQGRSPSRKRAQAQQNRPALSRSYVLAKTPKQKETTMIRRLALCFGISFVAIFLGVSAAGGEGPEGNTGEFPLISTIAFTKHAR
jgi:hypothetical protein